MRQHTNACLTQKGRLRLISQHLIDRRPIEIVPMGLLLTPWHSVEGFKARTPKSDRELLAKEKHLFLDDQRQRSVTPPMAGSVRANVGLGWV